MSLKKLFISSVFAAAAFAFAEVSVESSAANHMAKVGDTVTFTLSGVGELPPAVNAQLITNLFQYDKFAINRKGKDTVVWKTKAKAPGVFMLVVDTGDGFGSKNFSKCAFTTVAVSPEAVAPSLKAPADLLAYWDGVKAEMAKIPATPKYTLVSKEDGVELYEFEIDAGAGEIGSAAGVKAVGYMAKPEGDGPFPAVLTVYGAGSFEASKSDALYFAKKGAMSWSLNPHPLSNALTKAERVAIHTEEGQPLTGYNQKGKDTRKEDIYFNGMFKRDYQTARAIVASPWWNKRAFVVRGFSQGGAQTLATAFLCPEVTAIAPQCPAMCDLGGATLNRRSGWPFWIKTGDEQKERTIAPYFDMVCFAPHINAKMLVACGLLDGACAPAGQMALVNAYKGPKEIVYMPKTAHGKDANWIARESAFILEALGLN